MVDPVVRAKLADWLAEMLWELDGKFDDATTAKAIAVHLLGLPPSVRASLVGIEGLEEERDEAMVYEVTCAGYDLSDEEQEAFFDRIADAAHDLDQQIACSGQLIRPRTRYATPWRPAEPPVGVAGRNQPNPKEEEA